MIDIQAAIPHRPPFLLLDEVTEITNEKIVARYTVRPDDELFGRIFSGHYPGSPITPGVLLCEMVFQAAGVLVSHRLSGDVGKGAPVLTRIRDAKFKNMVRPGDTVEIEAEFEEQVSNAWYMKGAVKVGGKPAVRVSFSCAMVEVDAASAGGGA